MRSGAALFLELIGWLAGRRQVYAVRGDSMVPTLRDGDRVFVTACTELPEPGAVVVARHPTRDSAVLIKRLRSVSPTSFAVGSDDPTAGTDSRHFGSLPHEHLIGAVTGAWRRPQGKDAAG